jgi:hypothetical protein
MHIDLIAVLWLRGEDRAHLAAVLYASICALPG